MPHIFWLPINSLKFVSVILPQRNKARQRAQSLKESGVIEEFYIVQPEDYSVAKRKQYGTNYFREALVKTAYDFIGVPYLWGGASFDDGFDCSGLTMTVYQLNGLNLPRNSARQFEAGVRWTASAIYKKAIWYFFRRDGNLVFRMWAFISGMVNSFMLHLRVKKSASIPCRRLTLLNIISAEKLISN